jgi:hypothetical protein
MANIVSLLHPTEWHEPPVLSPWLGAAQTQVIERETSELESSSSATEKDNDKEARRQDRRYNRRN